MAPTFFYVSAHFLKKPKQLSHTLLLTPQTARKRPHKYSHQPNSKNNYSVTFSENRKSMMSFHRLYKEISHLIVYEL